MSRMDEREMALLHMLIYIVDGFGDRAKIVLLYSAILHGWWFWGWRRVNLAVCCYFIHNKQASKHSSINAIASSSILPIPKIMANIHIAMFYSLLLAQDGSAGGKCELLCSRIKLDCLFSAL